MSLLFRGERGERRALPVPNSLAGLLEGRRSMSAGQSVTVDSSNRLSAVWRCRTLIAGTVATLPVAALRGDREMPSLPPLLRSPSGDPSVDWSAWAYQVVDSLIGAGNAYGMVASADSYGRFPTQIETVHPDRVTWESRDGRWVTRVDGQVEDRWPVGRLWHVPLWLQAGSPIGLNPVQYHKATIGGGLAVREYGNQFYESGGHPSALFTTEQVLTQEQAKGVKDRLMERLGNREPLVLSAGLEYKPLQVSPQDAQYLDTMRFTVEDVCRVYGVPPEMLGSASSGQSVTYANREQRSADFLAYGLAFPLSRLETRLGALLPDAQTVKFRTGGLLRADIATRYRTYRIANPSDTFLTTNEIRALEDLPPLTNGGAADGTSPA